LIGQQNLSEFSEETNGCLSGGQTSSMLPLLATSVTGRQACYSQKLRMMLHEQQPYNKLNADGIGNI
jgi:hypothetical protein